MITLQLQVPSQVTDADDIVTKLSEWVETKPSVKVNGVTLDVDPSCPTMLDSFSSADCVTEATTPHQVNQSSSSSSLIFIIIGAVVAVIIIVLLIVLIIIVVYCKRNTYRYDNNDTYNGYRINHDGVFYY